MWLLLNSAGRCSAVWLQTGTETRPSGVCRNPAYAAWTCSISSACHQIM